MVPGMGATLASTGGKLAEETVQIQPRFIRTYDKMGYLSAKKNISLNGDWYERLNTWLITLFCTNFFILKL
jgi:hypothetical protein